MEEGTMPRWMRPLALLVGLSLGWLAATLGPVTAGAGVQVERGWQLYRQRCMECHGRELDGGWGPALERPDLRKKYPTIDRLRARIERTMPFGQEETLSQEDALDLAHFIYSRNGVAPDGFAEPAIRARWAVADAPIRSGAARRGWLWGPEGFATVWEEYAEAPGGKRLVQYFDKARLEITRLDGPRDRPDFVTSGLLVKELVTGQLQLGDGRAEARRPADVNVAGDADDRQGPTYATFAGLTGRAEPRQAPVTATIDRAGSVGNDDALAAHTDTTTYIPETGHNIPRVFWDFLHGVGPVERDGRLEEGPLFEPWYAAVGLPITEAYWARVKVGGQAKAVLIQVFERRVLTFTPDNPDDFRVEMGNVGRHYFAWRYGR
jgi:mono/diheme cytochrome c family protein